MQDNELFELCKSVYEATGWWDEAIWNFSFMLHPMYNTDYLLAKLPSKVRVEKHHVAGHPDKRKKMPSYDVYNSYRFTSTSQCWVQADTPLKALLKLTLELSKKGLLDAKDN